VQEVYKLVSQFPVNEEYGLISQIRRCAVSIPANIAEGAARQTKKEFIQFLHVSQGSLSELDTHLEISIRLGYVTNNVLEKVVIEMDQIDKMLTSLIKSLKKGPTQ
jgi:four helix bundle protein